ncbi:hypothetical protein JI59_19515 (plasmid) [Novosphingobium pentaromativorans US6-1]|uniref:DUF2332 domain-containing protein n=2 Tax=Novosphingobium pentaromativorans TaxID=205844 RepID=G6EFU3_9SPHN|nr:hypothetical protein JI59_19515 [Novosphingobium pentaromativorans US6-1]EHJ59632.1 hypothetical protein NSU_3214 [Novosphingobium pentaromativorans US6-1]
MVMPNDGDWRLTLPTHRLPVRVAAHLGCRSELGRQALFARSIGSPFVAAVLEAGQRQLDQAPLTADLIDNWQGDPASSAMAMRFNAAIHALARSEEIPALSALYRCEHDDFDGAIAQALRQGDGRILAAMAHPTQTNEVGRAAALLCALMVVQLQTGMAFDLLELGASCGLNLNLDHYDYALAGRQVGRAGSPVRVAPEWRGAPPPHAPVEIRSARGVDLNPPDLDDPATADRMLSYVWADQGARLERLALALDLARTHRPLVDRMDAGSWLGQRLAEPQSEGACRVVLHSMMIQYLATEERAVVEGAIRQAGECADARHPLAWISFEWTQDRSEVRLLLTLWPDGSTRHLATCHPYGAWIDWLAD